jgi:tetratricopeptide (TPR) repeat protein
MGNSSRIAGSTRIAISLLGIAACLVIIFVSIPIGFSRLLGRYGMLTMSIQAAAEAVRMAPSDADAHRALATAFQNVQMHQEARRELEIAISLRPNDDYLWLELGNVRDELDDSAGALSAFDQAVKNAPYYAHTHWQRGNLHLRMGRYDEAFAELREAARSNSKFLPNLIDLAWSLSREDVKLTEQLAGIESPDSRIAFARLLAKRGKGKETVDQFRLAANHFSEEYKRELVRELMAKHAYQEAFDIWKGTYAGDAQIYDGGFEGTISIGEIGFGWRIPHEQSTGEVSQDSAYKESGAKSIRIAFKGDSLAAATILSQTIIVKPQQKYQINFAVRMKDIVTGGPPSLIVADAGDEVRVTEPLTLLQSHDDWQKHSLDFTTPPTCAAIVLKLARNACQSSPCPIFGVLWLDSFSIEELKQ